MVKLFWYLFVFPIEKLNELFTSVSYDSIKQCKFTGTILAVDKVDSNNIYWNGTYDEEIKVNC